MDTPAEGTAPARAAHVLHLAPPEPARLARLAQQASVAAPPGSLRTLVLTDDAETALATAMAAASNPQPNRSPLVALTSASRAARVLAGGAPGAVVMPTRVAAALIGRSALPLKDVRHVVIAMPDAPNDPVAREALDAVIGELPKDATRTLVASRETPDVEAIVARHLFKARRTGDPPTPVVAKPGFAIRVITTSQGARWSTLRRLLDEADPPSAVVFADAATRDEAQRLLVAMGYAAGDAVQVVSDAIPSGASLVALVGLPDAATLRRAVDSSPSTLVVLCAPREIDGLRSLAGNVPVQPWLLDGPRAQAESREAALRTRLRGILESGSYARELLALAPLLDEYDGSEIAAAALALAGEQTRPAAPREAPPAEVRPPRDDRDARGTARDDRGARGGPRDERGSRGPARPPRPGGAGRFDPSKPRKPGGFRGGDRSR